MSAGSRIWLFKSEPDAFSIDDLAASPGGIAPWEGVRNYRARNILRGEVRVGDRVIFHHSSVSPPAAVGVAEVVRAGYPDRSDGSGDGDPVRWIQVDVRFIARFPRPVPIGRMREMPELVDLPLLRRGNRLSIQPVSADEFRAIALEGGLDPRALLPADAPAPLPPRESAREPGS